MASRRGKVHIITSELSLQFSLLIEAQSLVFIGHFTLDQVHNNELSLVLLLFCFTQVKILELVFAEQVDNVLVVNLEVADADFCIQFLVVHPAEDLFDAERDES